MDRKHTQARLAAPCPASPPFTMQDVLAQPSPDPNDGLTDEQWAAQNPQLAAHLSAAANTLRQSTPISLTKKGAAFLRSAVDANTDEPFSVKQLALQACHEGKHYQNDSDAKRI